MSRCFLGRALLFSWAFATCAAHTAYAAHAAPAIKRLAYLPASYGAGDEIQIFALLDLPPNESLAEFTVKPGQGLPEQGDFADPELRELRLVKSGEGWELRARLVPWSPGAGVIKAMSVQGIALPALAYFTRSFLGPEGGDISPPRAQRVPSGTAIYIYALAGAALLIVLAILAAAAWILPAAHAIVARWKAAQAFRRFAKSLDFLAAGASGAEPAPYFAALSRAFRLYLAERAMSEAPALTASELARLPESSFPAPGIRERSARLLAEADQVRYGGREAGPESMRSSAETARELGADIEEVLLARL